MTLLWSKNNACLDPGRKARCWTASICETQNRTLMATAEKIRDGNGWIKSETFAFNFWNVARPGECCWWQFPPQNDNWILEKSYHFQLTWWQRVTKTDLLSSPSVGREICGWAFACVGRMLENIQRIESPRHFQLQSSDKMQTCADFVGTTQTQLSSVSTTAGLAEKAFHLLNWSDIPVGVCACVWGLTPQSPKNSRVFVIQASRS